MPEPTELDQQRKEIESQQQEVLENPNLEEGSGEKPDESAEEFNNIQVDEKFFEEEYPKHHKIGIKSLPDLAERFWNLYISGTKDRQELAEFEELGYKGDKLKELKARLRAGDKTLDSEVEKKSEKSFKDFRRESFNQFIPQQILDNDTGEPRALTDAERKHYSDYYEKFAESIFPSQYVEEYQKALMEQGDTLAGLINKLEFTLYQLAPLKEKFKDEIVPDSLLDEMEEFYKDIPFLRSEISKKAGKDFIRALHQHFISQTNKDVIAERKAELIAEEKLKEEKKREEAKTETGQKKAGIKTSKPFSEMSLEEQRVELERQQKELT